MHLKNRVSTNVPKYANGQMCEAFTGAWPFRQEAPCGKLYCTGMMTVCRIAHRASGHRESTNG